MALTVVPLPTTPHTPLGHHPAPIAATLGTLPTGYPVKIWDLPPGLGIEWLLEIDPEQGTLGHLEHVHRGLDHPIRPYLWAALGTPDPRDDPAGFLAARWWDPAARATLALIRRMETAGLVHPWPPNTLTAV